MNGSSELLSKKSPVFMILPVNLLTWVEIIQSASQWREEDVTQSRDVMCLLSSNNMSLCWTSENKSDFICYAADERLWCFQSVSQYKTARKTSTYQLPSRGQCVFNVVLMCSDVIGQNVKYGDSRMLPRLHTQMILDENYKKINCFWFLNDFINNSFSTFSCTSPS